MLVDIRHAINDLDNPQLSTNLRKRFDKMHKVQTEDY